MTQRAGRPADRPLLDIRVELYVERPSQKAIVIGRGGTRLRDVGTRARAGIEALLGQQVYLDLHVRVAKDWQRDPKALGQARLLTARVCLDHPVTPGRSGQAGGGRRGRAGRAGVRAGPVR